MGNCCRSGTGKVEPTSKLEPIEENLASKLEPIEEVEVGVDSKRKVSANEVIQSFVQAEKYKFKTEDVSKLEIYNDLADSEQNHFRYQKLLSIRICLWLQLPPDIVWYRISTDLVANNEIFDTPWPIEYDEVKKVDLNGIVCFCHSFSFERNSLTVLEGNHRMSQYRKNLTNNRADLNKFDYFYVGISPSICHWCRCQQCNNSSGYFKLHDFECKPPIIIE